MSNDIIASFKNVCFSYDENKQVLKNVSFNIKKNTYTCIIGHNGSGKSTISKIFTGLLEPQSGEIMIYDEIITSVNIKFIRDNVGIIFQNPDSQFIGITSEDDIAFGLENRRIPQEKMGSIIENVAKKVEITNLLKYESQKLSGGEKQRVAIASVLAINPEIIIFDESTSMLDPRGKEELKQLMIDLRDNYNKTIISITHDMEEVIMADHVIVLNNGSVLKEGRPSEIFENENDLKDIKLDFPFTLKLASLLKEKGIDINLTLDVNELVKQICSKI